MTKLRSLTFAAFAAPLALALTACSDSAAGDGAVTDEPLEEIAAPDGSNWSEMITVTDYDGYLMGNPDAPIKFVEYGSLTCGGCAAFAVEAFEPLANEFVASGRVSYELRNLVRGPDDLVLARLVRCGTKDSFHPLSDQVWSNFDQVIPQFYQNQAAVEQAFQLPEEQRFAAIAEISGYLDFFASRGISRDQARQCLSDTASIKTIAENSRQQAEELGVTGTPTFFLDGNRLNAANWDAVAQSLRDAGAR